MPFGVITLLRRDTNIIMLTHEGQISRCLLTKVKIQVGLYTKVKIHYE